MLAVKYGGCAFIYSLYTIAVNVNKEGIPAQFELSRNHQLAYGLEAKAILEEWK